MRTIETFTNSVDDLVGPLTPETGLMRVGDTCPVLATPAAAAAGVATCWKVAGGVAGFGAVTGAAVAAFAAADG